jgi:cytochrome c
LPCLSSDRRERQDRVGPVLNGVIDRKAGTYPGYSYSDANKNSGLTWDEATFATYIKDPRAKIPGTKMIFIGIKDDQKIKDLIAFLKQYGPDGKKVQ